MPAADKEINVGVAFVSTGGTKMFRSLRSFRRAEPDLPVHIVLDVNSATWAGGLQSNFLDYIKKQPNVKLRTYPNTKHINGVLNEAMRWLENLGYSHGCLFHDDIVFSPLPEHKGHVSEWFDRIRLNPEYQRVSGFTFGYLQAFAYRKTTKDSWYRHPVEWDLEDLESEIFWRTIWPAKRFDGYKFDEGLYRLPLKHYFIQDCRVNDIHYRSTSLGPTGSIVPVSVWNVVGGFDEEYGIFYDQGYPVDVALKGLPPLWILPTVPHLHLHNQSLILDPAVGLWSNHDKAFEKKYGKGPVDFWNERDAEGYFREPWRECWK